MELKQRIRYRVHMRVHAVAPLFRHNVRAPTLVTGRVLEQTLSSEPNWGHSDADSSHRAPSIAACRLDMPPVSVLLRRALQLPIQRQVRRP